MTTALLLHGRWMLRRDLAAAVAICRASRATFREKSPAAIEGRFLAELRKRTVIGYVFTAAATDWAREPMAHF